MNDSANSTAGVQSAPPPLLLGPTVLRLGREEQPLRTEFLSLDQLTRHAHTLANWHHVAKRPKKDRLLRGLADNAAILREAYEFANLALREGRTIVPAAEWLLDNYYIIETHVRLTRQHLPRQYSQELPQLVGGPADGRPRVYDIAMELISHADGVLDTENLRHFLAAYQTVTPLKLGELWAIPIMLRLALLENLRRITLRITWQQYDRDAGAVWADRVIQAQENDPKQVIVVLAELIKSQSQFSNSFVAEYLQRLSGRTGQIPIAVSWLDHWFSEHGQTHERLNHLNSQIQAADQVSIGNSITSLRTVGTLDWKQFVEEQSHVDAILRSDPSSTYPRMSFFSRDRYRHVIERIAKRSPRSEIQVARVAIELAQEANKSRSNSHEEHSSRTDVEPDNHVGYYLVDRGRRLLEKSVGYRASLLALLRRFARRFRTKVFLGGLGAIWIATIACIGLLAAYWGVIGTGPNFGWWVPMLFLAVYASQFAVTLINWLCTLVVSPRRIDQLDFSEKIPAECSALVVVPTMLISTAGANALVDHLEVRYLANRDEHLSFALLTDFADADRQTLPLDEQLVATARAGIERLNRKYAAERSDIFYLFHRPRVLNESENVWMGYERKRGKLSDLNALLRGRISNAFSVIVGNPRLLSNVRYVITLDTDTALPRDTAHRMIGYMAHPLNQPRFHGNTGCVTRGYAILQPRSAVTIPEGTRSDYSRLFATDRGIDPYTNQVSDVYQDVFGEGSFIGKGIYDLQAFETALHQRFPDNQILSHDLIEGCHARSGFVSELELFEGFPSRYLADVKRHHRWVRGDWQIMGWLFRKVPHVQGKIANPLSWLSWWKIFDNLRRSLMSPALVVALISAWLFVPATSGFWTLTALGLIFLPGLITALPGFFRVPLDMPVGLHLETSMRNLGRHLLQQLFQLSVLPYTAQWNLDAVVRTLYRMFVSHKKMLEWTTATDGEQRASKTLLSHYRVMLTSAVVSLGLFAYLMVTRSPALAEAVPLLALWCIGPWLAWYLSEPLGSRQAELTGDERLALRHIARRTWHYFDTFVTEQDHWLAPDNFQEHPQGVLARRTSPTNIGMGLICNLSAWDFGYLSTSQVIHRVSRTLTAMDQLDRYRSHFYNWYDTRTLEPLEPRYISSVDSGNLAGLLLTLGSGLELLKDAKLIRPEMFHGLADTLRIALEVAQAQLGSNNSTGAPIRRDIIVRLERLLAESLTTVDSLARTHRHLAHLADAASDLNRMMSVDSESRVAIWVRLFEAQCRDFDQELVKLAPWVTVPVPSRPMPTSDTPEQRTRIDHLTGLLEKIDTNCTLVQLFRRNIEIHEAIDAVFEQSSPVASPIVITKPSTVGLAPDAESNFSVDPDTATQTRTSPPAVEGTEIDWVRYAAHFEQGALEVRVLIETLESLGQRCAKHAVMDFGFLYDNRRDLLSIGYNVSDQRMDASCYDLLASEARLASFVAIAQGQLPVEHWFALGRMLTTNGGDPTLLSWSGSMFEYLMPALIMPTHEGTLLNLAGQGAVNCQIQFGKKHGIPWGVSESCYNITDASQIYQYRAFGVPGLGLQRGLGDDLVVAPYACVMAAMVKPTEAIRNLEQMRTAGFLGEYGFYDAVDYTPSRRGAGNQPVICRTYMAHHSGMSLLALNALLFKQPMQRRFLADPQHRAHDLLLQERVPLVLRPVDPHPAESSDFQSMSDLEGDSIRAFNTADTAAPEVHLIGNGQYHVMVTNAGGGYSRWNSLDVTRWLPDATRDHFGQFCYIRDLSTREYWSNTFQPTLRVPEEYMALFSAGKAEFRRLDQKLVIHTTIGVSPEDDIEVRRVLIKNQGRTPRTLDITTYAEVVMAPQGADAAHRAFSNLFVTTELLPERHAIVCTRRPRVENEKHPVLFHLMIFAGPQDSTTSFETDRAKFIGRGRTLREPAALTRSGSLSNSAGAVLDPVASIRRELQIDAEDSFHIDIITGIAATREIALALIDKYQDHRLADRVLELAWPHEQVARKQFGVTDSDVKLFSRLAGQLIYGGFLYRPGASLLTKNRRNQSHLWMYSISGDLPIVVAKISDLSRLHFIRRILQAHAYWRLKGINVDLIIWNDDPGGYRHQTHDELMGMISSGHDAPMLDRPGGIFVRRSDQIPEADRLHLESIAAIVLSDTAGPLNEQLERRPRPEVTVPPLRPTRSKKSDPEWNKTVPPRDLAHFNGFGGFTHDGKEYITMLRPGVSTPAPWSNVIANEQFGTIVTEAGLGHTWFKNAHEYRLTPWQNDSICDPAGEALYIRDEETGRYFSPVPSPARGTHTYTCRHGFGYTVWEYAEAGLATEVTAFVAVDEPVKFLLIKVRNNSGRKRSISATGYVEWVLGEQRFRTASHIASEVDPHTGGILVRNPFSIDFHESVAFYQVSESQSSSTCDREEFVGRNGSLAEPSAMRNLRLSGRTGAGLDPCTAIQTTFELADGEEREIAFILGASDSVAAANGLMQRFKRVGDVRRTLEKVWAFWSKTLGAIYIETPDERLNILTNGWMLYQTLSCRFWGRTGFYQSGGAFGFRDQLQDSLALIQSSGHLTRAHILRCASRQFREGDVQHWWHPPTGRGVRTHFSDDYLWLPYAVAHYVKTTGDTGILDEVVGFLSDRLLAADEEAFYGMPQIADESASLYEHCRRAITHGLRFGSHGLPLMGCGDWNDGMNRVGIKGQGESVWLAFFLYEVLHEFTPIAEGRNDLEFAQDCREQAASLNANIQDQAWDGAWYRRAYFDNGQPLGSIENTECQIDALPQSWSVISGGGTPERMRQSMDAVYQRLVRKEEKIIQLFTPPFDRGHQDPGYIKGYVPGVRENGGQYTHAAIWTTMAFALMDDPVRAWECFELINPLNHALNEADAMQYKVEPYVIAADVYSVSPQEGRGGWTWYTGSAGWMYRLMTEVLLGMNMTNGSRLSFRPCVPLQWKAYTVHYRFHNTTYHLKFKIIGPPTTHVSRLILDGIEQPEMVLQMSDDGQEHQVNIELGSA